MNYKETLDFLYNQLPVYHRIGKAAYKASLDNSLALDEYFGFPHRKYISVHIAGTNGKGSVSHMMASVLQEAGFRTGLYTSPHLKDYRERIRINGKMIPEDEVTLFVEKNLGIISELKPSFFEMSVALAFKYFADSKVDVAIIETGLGGRLDSTNIIDPALSVITNIGFDHMDLLGDTLPKIAFEKAGIIKRDTPVIIGERSDLTDEVFRSKARLAGSELFFTSDLFRCSLGETVYPSGIRDFELVKLAAGEILTGKTPLGGDYQMMNIPVVAAASSILNPLFGISGEHLMKGIEKVKVNTGLRGRWEILGRNPLVICDTGHNMDGLGKVINQLGRIFSDKIHFVIGFVNDKDLRHVLPLFPGNASYYFTRASVPRALDDKILRDKALEYGLKGESYPTVGDAYKAARENAGRNDIVFIGGSTYVVAEVL